MKRPKKKLEIYVSLELFEQIDQAVSNCGVTRSEWACSCFESCLTNKRPISHNLQLFKEQAQWQLLQIEALGYLRYLKNLVSIGKLQLPPHLLTLLERACALNAQANSALIEALSAPHPSTPS